jgi:hypothetical protein
MRTEVDIYFLVGVVSRSTLLFSGSEHRKLNQSCTALLANVLRNTYPETTQLIPIPV